MTYTGLKATFDAVAAGYDPAQYLQLLNTYSNHLTLPDERRKCLRGGIAEVIEQHGGSVSKTYVSLLLAAHKV